jgi:hypothetical protein
LETTDNRKKVPKEEESLEPRKSEVVKNNVGYVEKIFKKILPIPDASKQRLQRRKEKLNEVKLGRQLLTKTNCEERERGTPKGNEGVFKM